MISFADNTSPYTRLVVCVPVTVTPRFLVILNDTYSKHK